MSYQKRDSGPNQTHIEEAAIRVIQDKINSHSVNEDAEEKAV